MPIHDWTRVKAGIFHDFQVEAHFDFLAVGDELPAFPLFLTPNWCVPLPLAETYSATFAGNPPYLRDLLSAPPTDRANGAT